MLLTFEKKCALPHWSMLFLPPWVDYFFLEHKLSLIFFVLEKNYPLFGTDLAGHYHEWPLL